MVHNYRADHGLELLASCNHKYILCLHYNADVRTSGQSVHFFGTSGRSVHFIVLVHLK